MLCQLLTCTWPKNRTEVTEITGTDGTGVQDLDRHHRITGNAGITGHPREVIDAERLTGIIVLHPGLNGELPRLPEVLGHPHEGQKPHLEGLHHQPNQPHPKGVRPRLPKDQLRLPEVKMRSKKNAKVPKKELQV